MEKYIFLRSNDSLNYFPDNKPHDFRIHLENPIDLHGYWKMGICEFFTLTTTNQTIIDQETSKPVKILIKKTNIYLFECVRLLNRQWRPTTITACNSSRSFLWMERKILSRVLCPP
jgi:hypothetical protein